MGIGGFGEFFFQPKIQPDMQLVAALVVLSVTTSSLLKYQLVKVIMINFRTKENRYYAEMFRFRFFSENRHRRHFF